MKVEDLRLRVWDKENKELGECNTRFLHLYDSDNFEIMRFTGRYDINGDSIFEGDIVEISSIPEYSSEESVKELYPVVFGDGAFGLSGRSHYVNIMRDGDEDGYEHDDSLLYFINTKIECKIVGNIYESKYLLNKVG